VSEGESANVCLSPPLYSAKSHFDTLIRQDFSHNRTLITQALILYYIYSSGDSRDKPQESPSEHERAGDCGPGRAVRESPDMGEFSSLSL